MKAEDTLRQPHQPYGRTLAQILLGALILLSAPRYITADTPEESYKRARELRKNGKLEEAKKELKKLLRVKRSREKARALLGLTCYQLGEMFESMGDRSRALSEFKEAVRIDPEEAYWHAALSDVMRGAGDIENAVRECAEATRLSPLDAVLEAGCLAKPSPDKLWEELPNAYTQTQKITPGISPPVPRYKPEPPFSEKARTVEHQGTVDLLIVVDPNGNVERMAVMKRLGLGLDQQCLQTVSKWRFEPAQRNGSVIRVKVRVEVQFRVF